MPHVEHSRHFRKLHHLATGVLAWGLLLSLGCGAGDNGPTAADDDSAPVALAASPARKLLTEEWHAMFIRNAKVGHNHFRRFEVTHDGKPRIRYKAEAEMTVGRYGQQTTQKISYQCDETPEGQLISFRTSIGSGDEVNRTSGEVVDGKLEIEQETAGKTVNSSMEWKPEWGGFFAAEQSLIEKPLKPGETRKLKSLLPVFNTLGEITMHAVRQEPVKILDQQKQLMRMEHEVKVGETTVASVQWFDDSGRIHKAQFPAMQQVTYLATEKIATAPSPGAGFDLGLSTTVKVGRDIPTPHKTSRVVYRATLASDSPADVFATSGSQEVKKVDDHTAEITVTAITANVPKDLTPARTKPTPSDREPNSMIQSDDAEIVRMAKDVAPGEADLWTLAQSLEQYVHRAITEKNFSQAFSTAAQVAKTREGDCTEHAVLLAALCRARNIPARTAVGLVYFQKAQGFAYHMWTEVYINDRWIPLDATLGNGGIGAAHLKISHSHLDGSGAYAAFLPVVQVLGQLKLEIVEVRYPAKTYSETR